MRIRWTPAAAAYLQFFRLPRSLSFPYLEGMDVRLNSQEIQAKIDRCVTETGAVPTS